MTRFSPKAQATRRLILEAATDCLAERGPSATTTREIAAKAGVTQPLLHHYFGSKEALFQEVLVDIAESYMSYQKVHFNRPYDDPRFFSHGCVGLFRFLGQKPKLLRISTWVRLDGVEFTPFEEVYRQVRERTVTLIDTGWIRPEFEPDILLLMLEATFKGFWDRYESIYQTFLSDHELTLPDRYLRQSMRMFLRGVVCEDRLERMLALLDEAI